MEGAGDGEVKVDLVKAEDGGGREDPSEENVMKKVENGEAIDRMDTGKEEVKLQIEDDPDPEASRDEEELKAKEESVGEEEKEEELKGVSVEEDKDTEKDTDKDTEKNKDMAGNLDGSYQGLVDHLRMEFGKGQHIPLASFLFNVSDHKIELHF